MVSFSFLATITLYGNPLGAKSNTDGSLPPVDGNKIFARKKPPGGMPGGLGCKGVMLRGY